MIVKHKLDLPLAIFTVFMPRSPTYR